MERACEAIMCQDFGDIGGHPNLNCMVDTGFVISSDDKYLYIITIYTSSKDKVTFCWTNEVKSVAEEPAKSNLEIKGELINKEDSYDLCLFKALRPASFKPSLCKFADPKNDEELSLVIKNYFLENRINQYRIEHGIFNNESRDYNKDNREIYVRSLNTYQSKPVGGGVVLNKDGALVGLIRFWNEDKNSVVAISGKTIEKFVRNLQDKDKVPKAPVEK